MPTLWPHHPATLQAHRDITELLLTLTRHIEGRRGYLPASQKPNKTKFMSVKQLHDEDTINNAQSKESLRYIVIEAYVL